MSEEATTPPTTEERTFGIQKIFVKDISFESPNAPDIFTEKWEPEINMHLGNSAVKLNDDTHEVTLTITITAKLGEKTAYLTEVHQTGIFNIKGFSEEEMPAMIGAYCPNLIFPFARETIYSLVNRGGFPQLILSPVNFDSLHAEHMKQLKEQAEKEAQTPVTKH